MPALLSDVRGMVRILHPWVSMAAESKIGGLKNPPVFHSAFLEDGKHETIALGGSQFEIPVIGYGLVRCDHHFEARCGILKNE